jgi:hypothetical protein
MRGLMFVQHPKRDKRDHQENWEITAEDLEKGVHLPELNIEEETTVLWMRIVSQIFG